MDRLLASIKDADARLSADFMVEMEMEPVTLRDIQLRLEKLGYRLDRGDDCRGRGRWMTGRLSGHSYPTINTGLHHIASGLRFANVNAPRDANFVALQELRRNVFVISRGGIIHL